MIEHLHYNSGQLLSEIQYHQQQKHGMGKCWYKNGQIWCEAQYYQGQLHGVRRAWCKNGELNYEDYFLYDREVTEEEYREHELITALSGVKI